MRKKEYIHIHALLAEVKRQLIENETIPAWMLAEYNALGTRPTGIHKSKQDHCEAILALSRAIGLWLKETRTDSYECPVN